MYVKLIAHTPNPTAVVAAAGKICYSAMGIDALTDGIEEGKWPGWSINAGEFVTRLLNMGHESPLEHVSFTFGIEGVSRSLLAQITRHRIASFSVQSQRYVNMADFKFVIPPEIEADLDAKTAFCEEMQAQAERYYELANKLLQRHYERFLERGMDEAQALEKAEEMAKEDARYILPNACVTRMIVTMNARELNHFFNLRCCNRAQWEIRELAEEMLKLVYPIAPAIFRYAGPKCVSCGHCTEGQMSCGKFNEVRTKYALIKSEMNLSSQIKSELG